VLESALRARWEELIPDDSFEDKRADILSLIQLVVQVGEVSVLIFLTELALTVLMLLAELVLPVLTLLA
jgi:hypothetical protein